MSFNLEKVQQNIEKCKLNILEFEKAEDAERATIKNYKDMIDGGDSPFPIDSLERGIQSSKDKIVIFQEAMTKERETIKLLYAAIEQNLERERLEEEKLRHIEIIRED